jgi:TorA maturation chaperone TorD
MVNGARNGGPEGPHGGEVAAGGSVASSERADLFRALGALSEEPRPEHRRLADLLELPDGPEAAEFTDLFLMNLYPYASVHLGSEGMLGGEARDRVAGFWQALGILPPKDPDHLGSLLGLLAELVEREESEAEPAARVLLGRARSALLREHLEPWVPAFLGRVKELAGAYYTAWANLLLEALREEAAHGAALPVDTERALQVELPLHLRAVPPVPDPREENAVRDVEDSGPGGGGETVPAGGAASPGETFLQALLAPVRSGMIVTRADLARAGRELELGTRMGERLYILKALLGQDPSATLSWLADEARRQAAQHAEEGGFDEGVTAFWSERAAATARLLDELASVEVGMNNGETDHG